jgi:hypothetical protein
MQSIRDILGIALQIDNIGDHINVVTKRTEQSDWFLSRDSRARFSSKRVVLTIYDQQRALVRNKRDSDNRILTHDGHISPTIISTGHTGSDSSEASLHKAFISCELLRGKDSGELPTFFRDSLNDFYEDLLLLPNNDFIPP